MIAIPIMIILIFFCYYITVYCFLQDNIEVSKLENKLTKTQSQIGFLIIAANTINDNGGSKQASDFIINLLGTHAISSSFPAVSIPQVQIVAIPEGKYSILVNNTQGYETVQQNECQGQIKAGEIKTCLITIDDSANPLSIPSSQTGGGQQQSATAQPPSPLPPQTEGAGDGTRGGSGNCLPGTPFHFTAAGDFRDNTNTDENMAANIQRLF